MKKKKIKKNTNVKRIMNVSNNYLNMRINQMLPYFYSAIALAMWNVLDETDEEKYMDIATLIKESQDIWVDYTNRNEDIIERCQEITGFNFKMT